MSFRALKAGDAFQTDIKMQRRYDLEEQLGTPQKVIEWIIKVTGSNNLPQGAKYEWTTIQQFLKDGVALCKLVNALLKSIGMPAIPYKAKVPSSFVAMSNVESFTIAAKQYGVPETSLFQTNDLCDGRKGPLLNVINCIHALGKLSNSRGFQPAYEGVAPPKQDKGIEDF